jgi:hypothetical protein
MFFLWNKKSLIFLLLIALGSCSSFKHSKYRNSFQFLAIQNNNLNKNKKPSQILDCSIANDAKSLNVIKEGDVFSVNGEISEKQSFIPKRDDVFNNHFIDSLVALNNTKTNNPVNKFIAKKIEKKLNKISSIDKSKNKLSADNINNLALLLICILLPPAAIWYKQGTPQFRDFNEFLGNENLILSILLYLPFLLSIIFSFKLALLFLLIPVGFAIYYCFSS